jgi:hypothetical protein
MKKIHFILLAICLIGVACDSNAPNDVNEIRACGVSDPAKNLPWLAELIANAEKDTVNYYGILAIWLEKYNGQDIFVINTMLGSVGSAISNCSAYYVYDCQKNYVNILEEEKQDFFTNLKQDIVIYVSPNYPNKEINACGVIHPEKNNTWLAELIAKAEEDTLGKYYCGAIWLKQADNGADILVGNMSLFGGGSIFYGFDCQGNDANSSVVDFSSLHFFRSILIYVHPTYIPFYVPSYGYGLMPYIY